MRTRSTCAALCLGVALSLTGCQTGDPKVEVVDLNEVLDIFDRVAQEPLDAPVEVNVADDGNVQPLDEENHDPAITDAFLQKFADALNEAALIESPIGVHLRADGSLEGFVDNNQDMVMDVPDEPHLFRIQVDVERSRLIASDESGSEHYHRDRSYRARPGGFFMGYMLGSMLSRQNGYYSSGLSARPNFGSMQMSSPNYHSQAVSQAKARVRTASTGSSARTRGGSGSFRFGK